MRIAATAAFLLILTGPVSAQSWQEYRYPDLGFSIAFPAEPKIADVPAKAANGAALTRKIISVSQNGAEFRVSVTDCSAAGMTDDAVASQAADGLRAKGKVLVDVVARMNRNYGRQFSIAGKDGSRTVAEIFVVDHKLYDIEGVTRADDSASPDPARFQQSLNFLGGGFGGFRRGGFRFAP